MFNLIPFFIYKNYLNRNFEGSFKAFTMFLDVVGFSSLTEILMKKEKYEGAEVLNNIITNVFEPVIDMVYKYNGFISTFEGDAFTSIFKDVNVDKVVICANEIKKIFKEKRIRRTKFGDFEVSIKIGLSNGNVDWGITGTEEYKTYYFKGEGINNCALSEQKNKGIGVVIDETIYKELNKKDFKVREIEKGFYNLEFINKEVDVRLKSIEIIEKRKDVLKIFFPRLVFKRIRKDKLSQQGEFRNILPVFVSFKDLHNYDDLNGFSAYVLKELHKFGGYIENLRFGDKGGHFLALFGAPISYEKNIIRALNFVDNIKIRFKEKVRIGITYGLAYTGFMDTKYRSTYVSPGNITNLSARFMMDVSWGNIYISEYIKKHIDKEYNLKDVGKKSFKGILDGIQVYELLDKKQTVKKKLYENKMVGKKEELEKLKDYIKPLYKSSFGGIVYIYGEAGIGKSRLVHEFCESVKEDIYTLTLQVDNILKKSMNPFIYVINDFFCQSEGETSEDKKRIFENKYDKLIKDLEVIKQKKSDDIIKELNRTKCFIGALLGHFWEGSLYEELDAKGRYENTLLSLKEFFKGLSLIKPIIIKLEDLHWLDDNSHKVFETLTRTIEDYPILIIATSRFNDDGTMPKLKVDKEVKYNDTTLDGLSTDLLGIFIENQLGNKANDKLLSFIEKKSEGNPFFIEQFCLYLKENDLLELKSNSYLLKEVELEIPSNISEIIISRIDRLSKELKEVTQIASVLGKEFELRVLKHLVSLYLSAVKETALDSLLISGEHEQIWNILTQLKYIFKHAILQETVYEMQLRERLRELHRLTGETIEKLYKDDETRYSELAYHYENAGEVNKTKEYLKKTIEYTKKTYQNRKIIEYINKLLKYSTGEKEQSRICCDKIEVLIHIGDFDKAINIIDGELKVLNNKGGLFINEVALLKILEGEIIWRRGNYKKAIETIKSIKSLLKRIRDDKISALFYNHMGISYKYLMDYSKALKCYKKVLRIRKKSKDKIGIVFILNNIGNVYIAKGYLNKAFKLYNKILYISKKINFKFGFCLSLRNIGRIFHKKGIYDKALKYYNEALISYKEIGHKFNMAVTITNIGKICCNKGNHKAAIEYFEEALEIFKGLGTLLNISITLEDIGVIYRHLFEFDRALKYYFEALKISKRINDKTGVLNLYNNIGVLYDYKGEYEIALKYLNDSLNIVKQINCSKEFLARILSSIGSVYYNKEMYQKSLYYFCKSLRIRKRTGLTEELGENYSFLAFIYNHFQKHEKALFTSLLHLKNIKENNNHLEESRTYTVIGKILTKTGLKITRTIRKITNITKLSVLPEAYFEKAIEISKRLKNLNLLIFALFEYGKYLYYTNKKEEGMKWIKKAYYKAKAIKIKGQIKKIKIFLKFYS